MHDLLIRHHVLSLPTAGDAPLPRDVFATLLSNIQHYGYGLTVEAVTRLRHADPDAVRAWWPDVEAAFRSITGDDRDMEAHVVYSNFPAEVLAMSEADYWIRQILMYWGLPNELFTTAPEPRKPMPARDRQLRMLRPATPDSPAHILDGLLGQTARWTDGQWEDVTTLSVHVDGSVALNAVPFKENLVRIAAWLLDMGGEARVETATDVLRLAVGLSDGDIALREPCKLRNFTRSERRFLIDMLESAKHLDEDIARRPERFKRLLRGLRPGDYASRCPRVVAAYDRLYNDSFAPSWAARVEAALESKDPGALALLRARPGEFLRRLHVALLLFGHAAAEAFEAVLPKLTVIQLLSIRRYLATVNDRQFRTIAPKGNWTRLQILDNPKSRRLPSALRDRLDAAIGAELRLRLTAVVPTATVDERLTGVTLPTNDGDLLPYGRGTAFRLPDHVTFVRTASYWASGPTGRNVWYDNGWNFFDAKWRPKGTCCWNSTRFGDAAIFSGDPTNSKDAQGRACQLIDLYPNKLASKGVRYAVWSLLCYSRKAFDDAREVFGLLQWGSKKQKGRLLEPSRSQLAFPVKGANYTKFVAWLDVKKREVVFMDANLRAQVSSALANTGRLKEVMPAFAEYLGALPTVHDLLRELPPGDDLVALYDDADRDLSGRSAYVFQPRSEDGDFEAFALTKLLAAKHPD